MNFHTQQESVGTVNSTEITQSTLSTGELSRARDLFDIRRDVDQLHESKTDDQPAYPASPVAVFGGCSTCRDHACCTKNARDGIIEPPFLTSFDQSALRAVISCAQFESRDNAITGNTNTFLPSVNPHGCPFYARGKCSIYNARPLDCRLFPLDVKYRDGLLHLILYDFPGCKGRITVQDHDQAREYFEALVPLFGLELIEYATAGTPRMDRELSFVNIATYPAQWLAARMPAAIHLLGSQ
jgi:Fe-S-cluster containining protein